MEIIEKKKKTKKFILLIMLLLSIFTFQTIVYSAVSSTFNITGSAVARVAADVRITGFRIASTTNSGVSNYEEFGKNHISTGLQLPSRNATVTYYVDVTNYGNTDVGIYSISGLPSSLTYTISDYTLKNKICDDTGKCNSMAKKTFSITLKASSWSGYTGDVNLSFDFRTFHKVTYVGITNNSYPTEVMNGDSLRISFKESLNRVQVVSNGNEIGYYASVYNGQTVSISNITSDVEVKIKPYVAQLVRGNLDTIGSEVCIGEECFYIISSDSSTIKMLSKYNLNVGYNVTGANFDDWTVTTEAINNSNGRQAANAIGSPYDVRDNYTNSFPWRGITSFATRGYWYNSYTNTLNSGYSIDFNDGVYNFAYVYNSSSTLYSYFNNYKNYLTNLGVTINDVRAIKGSELVYLGCDKYYYNCLMAPDWVRSTSYWTGNVFDLAGYHYKTLVVTPTFFGEEAYSEVSAMGVRPVVELPRTEINPTPNISKNLTVKSGNINTIGSEVCIGSECFYVLYSDSAVVTLIAKYNLQVGYRVTGWNSYTNSYTKYKISNASGKQCSTCYGARGTYEEPQFPFIGTIDFATDSYWMDPSTGEIRNYIPHNYYHEGDGGYWVYNNGSTLYPYVENYKSYLESLGVVVTNASIPYVSLYGWVACAYTADCSDIPSFMYDSSYWVGTAYGYTAGGMFAYYGISGEENSASSNELLGLRVTINIPAAMFN